MRYESEIDDEAGKVLTYMYLGTSSRTTTALPDFYVMHNSTEVMKLA